MPAEALEPRAWSLEQGGLASALQNRPPHSKAGKVLLSALGNSLEPEGLWAGRWET